jgi:PIN domain nuclease of toxin-antitoxin system
MTNKLLLDSNVLIPLVDEKLDLLPAAIAEVVSSGPEELAASVASLWEIGIKHRQGKLALEWPLEDWPAILFTVGVHIFDVKAAHVLAEADPVPDIKDPFDRLLLATCKAERLRLVTTDSKLRDHPLAWRRGSA